MAALSFLAPLALMGLLALPALWWLLRATPPQPAPAPFPPLRLLERLQKTENTPNKTPWCLIALRAMLLTCLILAFAGPVWRAADPITLPGDNNGPVLIVIQSDWASAPGWQVTLAGAQRLIEAADAQDRPVGLLAFPQPNFATPLPGDRAEALASLNGLEPQPVTVLPGEMITRVDGLLQSAPWANASLVWMGTGIQPDEALLAWKTQLASEHPLAVVASQAPAFTLRLDGGADGPAVLLDRVEGASPTNLFTLAASDAAARQLATASLLDEDGILRERIAFDLPRDLRNDIARIAITPATHAGEVILVDDRLERRRVGVVGAERRDEAQPLLSGTTFVERALAPIADVTVPRSGDTSGEIASMIDEGVNVIVLVDVASLIPSTVSLLEAWIEDGGVLVRFASSGLIQSADALLPVPLRAVDRQLGGALTWEEPQTIAPFSAQSPFAGLAVPDDVRIERQVLSEPGAGLLASTYAELADATPLVSGVPRGDGYLVLFHVTADTSWSNLPLSGLFLDMMGRLVALSTPTGTASQQSADAASIALAPRATLDGFGALGSPPTHAEGLVVSAQAPSPMLANPPGFYGPADGTLALNLFTDAPGFIAQTPETLAEHGLQTLTLAADEAISLRPTLLGLAAFLALVDGVVALALSGALAGALAGTRAGTVVSRTAGTASMIFMVGLFVMGGPGQHAVAQNTSEANTELSRLLAAANSTRLAYVITGNSDLDQRSREGLNGLSSVLTQRTAFEPGAPMAVDPSRDELAFYPLIYWPMPEEPIAVSDQVIARIEAYMNNGGTILFDTRDEASNFASTSISPQTANLRALLAALDIPALEPVPDDHVLTKSFYLIDSFPGRFATGPLWVEALPDNAQDLDRPARGGDGVTPLMITGNDYASAWALSPDGRPLYATSPPDPRQREFAFRTGVNIGMYVMTGNYKADQVHIPALLERLVQ